jgi:hypothetical protein
MYDSYRWAFNAAYPNYDPEIAARTTNEAWLSHLEENQK